MINSLLLLIFISLILFIICFSYAVAEENVAGYVLSIIWVLIFFSSIFRIADYNYCHCEAPALCCDENHNYICKNCEKEISSNDLENLITDYHNHTTNIYNYCECKNISGNHVIKENIYCPICGTKSNIKDNYCSNCGTKR